MNTNSERYAVQLYVEAAIGCSSSAELPGLVGPFEAFTVGHQGKADLAVALEQDAKSLLRKGVQTILQALIGLDTSNESWSLIRFYYATFFLLREALAAQNVAIIRCKNIYTLKVDLGQKPKKHSGKNYRGDHQATIRLHNEINGATDILLSQHIEGLDPYDWLRDKREWINYRRREFFDAGGEAGFSNAETSYADQIASFCKDGIPIYCFDPDTAALALPLKRVQLTLTQRSYGSTILNECIEEIERKNRISPSCRAFIDNI